MCVCLCVCAKVCVYVYVCVCVCTHDDSGGLSFGRSFIREVFHSEVLKPFFNSPFNISTPPKNGETALETPRTPLLLDF